MHVLAVALYELLHTCLCYAAWTKGSQSFPCVIVMKARNELADLSFLVCALAQCGNQTTRTRQWRDRL